MAMSTRPARVFKLPGGTLTTGAPADVVVFDPEARWTVTKAAMFSKSRNTPFEGRELPGKVLLTVVDGRIVYRSQGDG